MAQGKGIHAGDLAGLLAGAVDHRPHLQQGAVRIHLDMLVHGKTRPIEAKYGMLDPGNGGVNFGFLKNELRACIALPIDMQREQAGQVSSMQPVPTVQAVLAPK